MNCYTVKKLHHNVTQLNIEFCENKYDGTTRDLSRTEVRNTVEEKAQNPIAKKLKALNSGRAKKENKYESKIQTPVKLVKIKIYELKKPEKVEFVDIKIKQQNERNREVRRFQSTFISSGNVSEIIGKNSESKIEAPDIFTLDQIRDIAKIDEVDENNILSTKQKKLSLNKKVAERFIVNVYESGAPKRSLKMDKTCIWDETQNKKNLTIISLKNDQNIKEETKNSAEIFCSTMLNEHHSGEREEEMLRLPVNNNTFTVDAWTSYESSKKTCTRKEFSTGYPNTIQSSFRHCDTSYNTSLRSETNNDCVDNSVKNDVNLENTNLNNTEGLNPDIFFRLKKDIDMQCEILRQASKAVDMCKKSKTSADIVTEMEVERVLLLAALRRDMLLYEMRNMQFLKSNKLYSFGTLKISNLLIPLYKHIDNSKGKFSHWFVCMLSSSSKVFATRVINSKETPTCLKFPDDIFEFNNLNPNFVININIYTIKLKNYVSSCINRKRKPAVFQRKKLFHQDVQTNIVHESQVWTSSFILCGNIQITRQDMHSNKYFKLENMQSELLPATYASLSTLGKICIPNKYSNFLHIGVECGETISWNRRWCQLEGPVFKVWRDPNEDVFNEPLVQINLEQCVTKYADFANRNTCARRWNLLLRVSERSGCDTNPEIIRKTLFLAADSESDINVWKEQLNGVLTCLKEWKALDFANDN